MRTAIALAALVATASAYVAGPRFGAPARATAARSVVVKGSFFDNFGEGMKERASAPAQMSPRGVVVTGGAGGVGYAYVEEFVRTGHMVVFCDINEELLAAAQATVEQKYPGARVFGIKCDVGMAEDVEKLAAFAKEKLGVVHYWVNNAGINGGRKPFVDLTPQQIEAVVKVNMLGSLLCTSEALKLMKEQRGVKSHIFNTVGSGVKGGGTPGYASYGATKRGLPQFTQSLNMEMAPETKGQKDFVVPLADDALVGVHTLSPGMVFTNLLLDDSTADLRKFFDVLASEPEEVAADLVPKILGTSGTGSSVEYLTPDKVVTRLFSGFVLGMRGRNFDKETGERIQRDGQKYMDNGVRVLAEKK